MPVFCSSQPHRPAPAEAPLHLALLAAAAALLEAEAAAEPIFIGLLRHRARLAGQPLALTCAALACIGRPRRGIVRSEASSACSYLLAHHESDLPAASILALGATALYGSGTDPLKILRRLATAMATITAEDRRPIGWQAPLRNLAFVLYYNSDLLVQNLDGLVGWDPGNLFLRLLGSDDAEAIEFIDVNDKDSCFAGRLHSRVYSLLVGPLRTRRSHLLYVDEGSKHFEFFYQLVKDRFSRRGRTEVRRRLERQRSGASNGLSS